MAEKQQGFKSLYVTGVQDASVRKGAIAPGYRTLGVHMDIKISYEDQTHFLLVKLLNYWCT